MRQLSYTAPLQFDLPPSYRRFFMKISPATIVLAGLTTYGAVQLRRQLRYRKATKEYRFDGYSPSFEADYGYDHVVDAIVVQDEASIEELHKLGTDEQGNQIYQEVIIHNDDPTKVVYSEPFTLAAEWHRVPTCSDGLTDEFSESPVNPER